MILQTQIPIKKETSSPICYDSKMLLLGSCFSENIANKFAYYKFQSNQNPFGILFHPKAIETFITNVIHKKEYTESDVFFQNERWHCFEAHSSLSTPNKEVLLQQLNARIKSTNKELRNATHISITLGTAWLYRFIASNRIVANCHKIPQKEFLKELLSVDEIATSLKHVIALLRAINSNASILFTVSPVRHLKDGFVQNQQSKSHLLAAIHQVVNSKKKTHYFPSYEIMMDELRDYRFYKEDMIHPNQTAVAYIWEKFCEAWLSEDSEKTMQEVADIQKRIGHKPFNVHSEQHQQFLSNLEMKIKRLQEQHPRISFDI